MNLYILKFSFNSLTTYKCCFLFCRGKISSFRSLSLLIFVYMIIQTQKQVKIC